MEKIFEEYIISDRTRMEKLAFIEYLIRSAPKPEPDVNWDKQEASHKMMRSAIELITGTSDAFVFEQCFRVFEAWGIKEFRESFFTANEVSALLMKDCANPIWTTHLLMNVMQSLKDSDSYSDLCANVAKNASNFVTRHRRYDALRKFCIFLIDFPECLPSDDDLACFCYSLLNSVSCMEQLTKIEEIIECLNGCPAVIGGLLERIWQTKSNHSMTVHCLEMVFPMMASAPDNRVSLALGAVLQFVPDRIMRSAIEDLCKNQVATEEQLRNVVNRLIDWLSWPKITHISNWLLLLLERMNTAGQFELLKELAETNVPKLYHRLNRSELRENIVNVFFFFIKGNQDSKEMFYEIIKFLPTLFRDVEREKTPEGKKFLADFSILVSHLILLHADKLALYKPILDLIGHNEALSDHESDFRKQSWSAKKKSLVRIPVKSISGKTGLQNRNNICFVNAAIQLISMCDSYSGQFIRRNLRAAAKVSTVLQKYLVLLKFSLRPSVDCSVLARQLFPPHFIWGRFEDSSEFLSHLIDGVMEEEKLSEDLEKLAKDSFSYTVLNSQRCRNCQNETLSRVPDIDLRLIFNSESTTGKFGIRGGNQSSPSSDAESNSEDRVQLEDMLSSIFKTEEISEYSCDNCITGPQAAEKRTTFCETPNFLKVTLNRFSYEDLGPQKITKVVDIPRTLLVPVCRHGSMENDVFCLVGIIVHVGFSANSGHYYCIARNQIVVDQPPSLTDFSNLTRDSDFFEDRWFEFNDEDVTLSSYDAFARSSSSRFSTPYVIMYKKVTDAALTGGDSLLLVNSVEIPKGVLQTVLKDNEEYRKEQEVRKRPRSPPSKGYSWKKDDDDDSPSSPGNFLEGPRMIF